MRSVCLSDRGASKPPRPRPYDEGTPYTVGLMFGLRRKKLSGSYFFFSAANRS